MTKRVILFGIVFMILFCTYLARADVSGGTTNQIGNSQRAPSDVALSVPAQAGNVTELNVFGYSTTQSWQGYFGNVTGTIQLTDASNKVMYNWSVASPKGEIYAAVNDSVSWTKIECFNYTATGAKTDDSATQAGATSLTGMNLTQLETLYNISSTDVDGVDETFNLFGASSHSLFYTNSLQFSSGECRNTRVYDSSGAGQPNNFQEVLLYDPFTKNVVFTSLLNQDQAGFDSKTHDFEMLVLENGHNGDITAIPYYFYVELQ